MASGGISNGECIGKFLIEDLVEKYKVDMEANSQIKMLCGDIQVMEKVGSLVNS